MLTLSDPFLFFFLLRSFVFESQKLLLLNMPTFFLYFNAAIQIILLQVARSRVKNFNKTMSIVDNAVNYL